MTPPLKELLLLAGKERRDEGEAAQEEGRRRVRPAERRHLQDQDPAGGQGREEDQEEQGVQVCQGNRLAGNEQGLKSEFVARYFFIISIAVFDNEM